MIMNIFLVVPTIRNLSFLGEWKDQFKDCSLIVVEDHETKQIDTPISGFKEIYHYSWEDIQKEFGDDEWIFSRKNAGIRSYGFWKAHQLGADVVVTLDDDCYPTGEDFIGQHIKNLESKAPVGWFATFPHPAYMYTRGFPYTIRNQQSVVISHGLWSNKMDMDAKTQLSIGEVNIPAYPLIRQFVPSGLFFPMSSMNLAFTREAIPLMYFPLMGTDPKGVPWGYDRYDDIWAGVIAKKILDHIGLAVVNGSPFVEHRKASDPLVNLVKEKEGMAVNEDLWLSINAVPLTAKTITGSLEELLDSNIFSQTKYLKSLQRAMKIWITKFLMYEKR